MKVLSLKLKETIFGDTERILKKISMSRNAYINEALHFFNLMHKRKLLKGKLHKESKAVHASSLEVLREMEAMEDKNTA